MKFIYYLFIFFFLISCEDSKNLKIDVEQQPSNLNSNQSETPIEVFRALRDSHDLDSIDELLSFCREDYSSKDCDQALDHLWMKLPGINGWTSNNQKLLNKMKSSLVVDKISKLADSSKSSIKYNVINILASVKTDNSKEIIEGLLHDRDQSVREKATKALEAMKKN
jgi:HEAT repeat protein